MARRSAMNFSKTGSRAFDMDVSNRARRVAAPPAKAASGAADAYS
jgi:hypothetical protein